MISLNQLKKTRSSVAALSTLIALQSLYAQSADAQVTFTSTISALTCTISINNASGQSTATVAIGNTSLASGAINVPQYTKLTTPTAFTVGFKGSGGIGLAAVTETCAYTGKLNVAFGNRGLIRVKSDKGQLKVAWGDKPDEMCLSSYEIKAHQQALESGYTLLDLTCAR